MKTEVYSWRLQRELHVSAARCLGTISGRNPRRAEAAREAIRKRLRSRGAH